MFTPKPKNRKRRSGSKRTPRANTREESNSLETLRQKEYELHAQIGELEDVLASLTQSEERRKEMQRENILPPPDYPYEWGANAATTSPHHYPERRSHGRKTTSRLSSIERREELRRRNASGIRFFILFIIAAALAFWLFYTGG